MGRCTCQLTVLARPSSPPQLVWRTVRSYKRAPERQELSFLSARPAGAPRVSDVRLPISHMLPMVRRGSILCLSLPSGTLFPHDLEGGAWTRHGFPTASSWASVGALLHVRRPGFAALAQHGFSSSLSACSYSCGAAKPCMKPLSGSLGEFLIGQCGVVVFYVLIHA